MAERLPTGRLLLDCLPAGVGGGAAKPAKRAPAVRLGRGGALGPKVNKGEELFAFQLCACELPAPQRNFRFHASRKWEIDFAWPEFKIGMEIQGGIWGKSQTDDSPGAHGHPIGIRRDMQKHNALLDAGWRVWHFTPEEIKRGLAVQHLEGVLGCAARSLLSQA